MIIFLNLEIYKKLNSEIKDIMIIINLLLNNKNIY